jgi:hypothetical protein
MFKCDICGKEFDKFTSLGGHKVSHGLNFKESISKSQKLKADLKLGLIQDFNVTCEFCNSNFIVSERQNKFPTKEKYFCNVMCSTKYSSSINKELKNLKISKKATEKKISKQRSNICLNCNLEFSLEAGSTSKRKTCSDECKKELTSKNISKSVKGKTGGYRSKSGTGKKFGGTYKDIWFDSQWEIKAAKRMDDIEIIWQREGVPYIEYEDKTGKSRKYYPDFYIPEFLCYLEVKGYLTEESHFKLSRAIEKERIAFVYSLEEIDSIDRNFFLNFNFKDEVRSIK